MLWRFYIAFQKEINNTNIASERTMKIRKKIIIFVSGEYQLITWGISQTKISRYIVDFNERGVLMPALTE